MASDVFVFKSSAETPFYMHKLGIFEAQIGPIFSNESVMEDDSLDSKEGSNVRIAG